MSSFTSSSDWRFLRQWAATVIAVIFIIGAASEWLLRVHVALQDNFQAHAQLLEASRSSDAAFGDSHVARGFAPPGGMLNLAFPSENITQIAQKVQAYYSTHDPEHIIIQADPHLFAPYRLRDTGVGAKARHQAESSGLMLLAPERRRAMRDYWIAFAKGGGMLTSKIERLENGALLSPGDLSALSPRALELIVKRRVRIHRPISGPLTDAAKNDYAGMLSALRAKGAQICLVSFPVSPPYRAAMAESAAPTIAFYRDQAARVDARYVDHRALIDDLNQFRDADHLNKAGALAYSPRLMQSCFGEDVQ
jgi:hypothetical protein